MLQKKQGNICTESLDNPPLFIIVYIIRAASGTVCFSQNAAFNQRKRKDIRDI